MSTTREEGEELKDPLRRVLHDGHDRLPKGREVRLGFPPIHRRHDALGDRRRLSEEHVLLVVAGHRRIDWADLQRRDRDAGRVETGAEALEKDVERPLGRSVRVVPRSARGPRRRT